MKHLKFDAKITDYKQGFVSFQWQCIYDIEEAVEIKKNFINECKDLYEKDFETSRISTHYSNNTLVLFFYRASNQGDV